MGSLVGFRHPQFSEEGAWLPTWLQQHSGRHSYDDTAGGETCFEQRIQDLHSLGQNIHKEANEGSPSKGHGGYLRCPLALSDESCPLTFISSTGNEVPFRRQLSSDYTDDIGMPLVDESKTQECASGPLSTQVTERKINQCNQGQNACQNGYADFGHDNEKQVMRPEASVPCSQVNVKGVVELSIAASEAVLIHEIISGLVSESFLASMVLEAASQLKETRLNVCEEACSSENVSQLDYLSDLEDSSMAEAYEDVGLSPSCTADLHTNNFCSANAEHNLLSKNDMYGRQIDCGGTRKCMDVENHKPEEITKTCTQLQDGIKLDVSCTKEQKKPLEDQSICIGYTNGGCQNKAMNVLDEDNIHTSGFSEEVDCEVKEDILVEASVMHSPGQTFKDAGKYNQLLGIFPARFKSRWYGGWTWKEEMKSSAPVEHQFAEVIPEFSIGTTSFLSESADMAPDENSFVQRRATATPLTSQLSADAQVNENKANDRTWVCEDLWGCSSLPSNDSLCSVVPCSISCEGISSTPILDNDVNICTGRNSISSTKYPPENTLTVASSPDKFACAESTAPFTHLMQSAIYRHSTSLRPYSVLLPGQSKYGSFLNTLSLESLPKPATLSPVEFEKETCNPEEDIVKPSLLISKEEDSLLILDQASQQFSRALRCDFSVQEKPMVQNSTLGLPPAKGDQKVQTIFKEQFTGRVQGRKRVRFIDSEANCTQRQKAKKQRATPETCNFRRTSKYFRYANQLSASRAFGLKRCQGNCSDKDQRRRIFQNIEFLLTGFSNRKEKKLEVLIRKYSGMVLHDIPATSNSGLNGRPVFNNNVTQVVISPKKLQTIKFLYGCAVNAFLLRGSWITDSIAAGSLLPPKRYSILPKISLAGYFRIRRSTKYNYCHSIFGNVGVMLHGKNRFCFEMAKLIQYGGGQVFTSLQSLIDSLDSKRISIAVIVSENESSASRHLKHFAMEQKIPVLSTYWITKSLHKGKLLPFEVEKNKTSHFHAVNIQDFRASPEMSEEI